MTTGNENNEFKEFSDHLSLGDKLLTPQHLRKPRTEAFSEAWYDRCNQAYVDAVRMHHPERELRLWPRPRER